jgi:hypothetical protein
MSTLHKMTILFTFLLLVATGIPPAHSGPASAGEALPAPDATTGGVRPSASVSPEAPASATIRPSEQSLARLQNILSADMKAAVPVLVIPAQEIAPDTYDRIVEDLTIMGRIIEKNLREAPAEAYGFTMKGDRMYGQTLFLPSNSTGPRILRSSSGRPKAIYIGGYGVIFSLQVDFPLVPPPETPEPNKAAEKADQVWAAAQRELADPQAAMRLRLGTPQGWPYRTEAVEGLKNALLAALKHATNIRDLEPDSWLTILVQGPASTAEAQVLRSSYEQSGQDNLLVAPRPGGRTLLTLRAKKADIDRFAKGEIDETQFQRCAQLATY